MAQNKRFEENKKKAQALAGDHQADAVEDPQLQKRGFRKERESRPSSGGNAVEGKMIDLGASENETKESGQDTNLAVRSSKEKEAYKIQCRPTCSKIPKELHEGVTGRKSKKDKTRKKDTRAASPFRNPAKITEVDLVSDSEE